MSPAHTLTNGLTHSITAEKGTANQRRCSTLLRKSGRFLARNVMTRWTRPWIVSAWLGLVAVFVLAIAVPADAQSRLTRKWEVEFHVGGSFVSSDPDGAGNLPAAGPPFTTVVGTTSRQTSSWY